MNRVHLWLQPLLGTSRTTGGCQRASTLHHGRTPTFERMKKTILLLAAGMVLVGGCKNKDEEVLPDPHHNSVLSMAMHWWYGTEAFHTDSLFTDDFGHTIEVDEVLFYMGNPWFSDELGDSVAGFAGKYFLIDAAEGGLIRTIGEVDAHLHEMHVDLGLDSAASYSDISTAAPPLNVGSMYWLWNGRVFARVKGKVDLDGDGVMTVADGTFSYDCGSLSLLRHLLIEVHTDANIGSNVILDFDVDVKRILQGVDVVVEPVTHTDDDPVLALQIIENLTAAITHP